MFIKPPHQFEPRVSERAKKAAKAMTGQSLTIPAKSDNDESGVHPNEVSDRHERNTHCIEGSCRFCYDAPATHGCAGCADYNCGFCCSPNNISVELLPCRVCGEPTANRVGFYTPVCSEYCLGG